MSEYQKTKAEIATLQKKAKELRRKEMAAVVVAIRKHIKEFDLTPADLGFKGYVQVAGLAKAAPKGARGKKAAGPARAAKYRNPATGETWSGFGVPPAWMRQALASGATKESFLIAKAAPAKKAAAAASKKPAAVTAKAKPVAKKATATAKKKPAPKK